MNKTIAFISLFILIVVGGYFIMNSEQDSQEDVIVPTPTIAIQAEISGDWESYTSDTLKYSISYPQGYQVESNGIYSITIVKPMSEPGFGPANFIYVSVVPEEMYETSGEVYNYYSDQFKKLQGLEIGESVSVADTDQPDLNEWYTYTRVDDTQIDGHPTRRFENTKPWEFPGGTTEVRYVFDTEGDIYILGHYTGGDSVSDPIDPREAHRIITSFVLGG